MYVTPILKDNVKTSQIDCENDENHSQNENENEQIQEVSQKDWFAPAVASMARLNQIQANIYTMGFLTPSDIKCQSNKKQLTERNVTQVENVNEDWESNNTQINYTDLKSGPPLSSASYMRTAWGSNHSIPELVAQQCKKIINVRPSSAKSRNCRSRLTTGNRPQSAKEPLCSNQETKTTKSFGVCGQRKTVLSPKPPSGGGIPPTPSRPMIPRTARAGAPAGHIIKAKRHKHERRFKSPTAPPASPVDVYVDEDVFEENEISDKYPHSHSPPLLRRPLAQPIHLSLPSINDSVDVSKEDGPTVNDDMDTERLLAQADSFLNHQKTVKDALISKNATLPNDTSTHPDLIITKDESEYDTLEIHNAKCREKTSSSHRNGVNYRRTLASRENKEIGSIKATRLPKETDNENIPLSSVMGVRIREDKNLIVDITPRNAGRKVHNNISVKNDNSKNSVSCSEKKNEVQKFSRSNHKHLVAMVNVEYQTDDVSVDNDKKTKGRKKKTMDEVETIVSQLSRLNACEDDKVSTKEDDDISSQLGLHKSDKEKNYYEISRSQSQQSQVSENTSEKEENTVCYKTTKTIEFGEDSLQEANLKSAIRSFAICKPSNHKYFSTLSGISKLNQRGKERSKCFDETKENFQAERETKDESQPDVDELADMLKEAKSMAESSLYNAQTSRPPSGKKLVPRRPSTACADKKSKDRPLTAGSRPRSATEPCKHSQIRKSKSTHAIYSEKEKRRPSSCRHSESSSYKPAEPVIINSIKTRTPIKSIESEYCKEMQSRMAELGMDVDPHVLERALYAPAGESLHYQVPGSLPTNPSAGLHSHYKNWLAEDYKHIQLMKKRLDEDDHLKHLEKLAAEKKMNKSKGIESKGKKKKKKKIIRSNSMV